MSVPLNETAQRALIFDIKRGSSEDGPGLRTTVFFKGCPLSCVWCHNPEGIDSHPTTDTQGQPVGNWITLDELLYRLRQDYPFYRSSGGGVTLSGGEPTMQMKFAGKLLEALHADGIHTAIETCGFFNYRRFSELMLPYLDLIYFDLKLMSDDESRCHTGSSNRLILDNFTKLVQQSAVPVIPRVPLVPGITATERNLQRIAGFLASLGIKTATLLPYNPLWHDKAVKIKRVPLYHRNTFMTQEEVQTCVDHFCNLNRKKEPENAN